MTRISNTTIQNRSKQTRLAATHIVPTQNITNNNSTHFLKSLIEINAEIPVVLYNLGRQIIGKNRNSHYLNFLNEYTYPEITINDITDEFDLLGTAYQFLSTKMDNLKNGRFYTNADIAVDITQDFAFENGEVLLDPSCGSGVFLFASDAPAEQLVGVDFDPIAVMIAKFNYFIKFPDASYPKIYCSDFFKWYVGNKKQKYDYIVGNPPYGANIDISTIKTDYITTGESFSYFIEYSYSLLKSNGILNFILPESLLNVKRHQDIRDFILEHTNLDKIKQYGANFSGVMSDIYSIKLNKEKSDVVHFITKQHIDTIPKSIYVELKNHIFAHLTPQDAEIIKAINKIATLSLKDSIFALGVVTGDNKTKLFDERLPNTEHIYTGKDLAKYKLAVPKKWLIYDRSKLQQVAPDEIYRAPAKILYKTISKWLTVAIDYSGSLSSNSANIIIPRIKGHSIESVALLLNSRLYNFLNLKLFGGVNKVARENLEALPFMKITKEQNQKLTEFYHKSVQTGEDSDAQQYIYDLFKLTNTEINYIERSVN